MAAVVLGVFSLTVTAPPASAKPACWKQIIDDWVDDGVIQGVYPLHCYGEATRHVPNDLQQYTGIVDDINAARQRASRSRVLFGTNQPPAQAEANPNDPDSSVYNSAIDKRRRRRRARVAPPQGAKSRWITALSRTVRRIS